MVADIRDFVLECPVCQIEKGESRQLRGNLQNLKIPEKKWSEVSLDFITKLPKTARWKRRSVSCGGSRHQNVSLDTLQRDDRRCGHCVGFLGHSREAPWRSSSTTLRSRHQVHLQVLEDSLENNRNIAYVFRLPTTLSRRAKSSASTLSLNRCSVVLYTRWAKFGTGTTYCQRSNFASITRSTGQPATPRFT